MQIEQDDYSEKVKKECQRLKLIEAELCYGQQRLRKGINIGFELQEDSEQKVKSEILDFFKRSCTCPLDLEGYFCQKYTPDIADPDLRVLEDSIVIYGADFMSTHKVLKYFTYFQLSEIKWLDDSSCLIGLWDAHKARRAIFENAEHFTDKKAYEEELTAAAASNNIADKLKWYKIIPYYQLGFERTLQARLATNKEKDNYNLQQAKYMKFSEVKQSFLDIWALKYKETRDKIFVSRSRSQHTHREESKRPAYQRRQRGQYNRPDRRQRGQRDFGRGQRRDNNRYGRNDRNHRNDNFRRNRSEHNHSVDESFRKRRQVQERSILERSNYSFVRNQDMKQQADRMEDDDQLSELSFVKRFQQMTINQLNNSKQLNQSFNKNPNMVSVLDDVRADQQDSQQDHNMSFRKGNSRIFQAKAEEDQNMSFVKNKVIETIILDDQ